MFAYEITDQFTDEKLNDSKYDSHIICHTYRQGWYI